MFTVNILLARKGATECTFSDRSSTEPVFFLAFTRRGAITIEELCASAMIYNLHPKILDDYTFDLFGNNVDRESMFWGDTIIAFSRGHGCFGTDGSSKNSSCTKI